MAQMKKPEPATKLVTINENEVFEEGSFEADLDIDLDNLSDAMKRHGPCYWKYGKLHALALSILERKELTFEIAKRRHGLLEAQKNAAYRMELLKHPEIKVTEKAIDTQVMQDEEYLDSQAKLDDMQHELIASRETVNMLSLAEKIFSKRTDLLNTLGYLGRSEFEATGVATYARRVQSRTAVNKFKGSTRMLRDNKEDEQ